MRDKETMFWVLLFPIVLSILFRVTLSNINKGEAFEQIPIAVVEKTALVENQAFSAALDAVSGDDGLFDITYTSAENAATLLDDNKAKAVIEVGDEIGLTVSRSGLNQTIVKSFIDEYMRNESTISNILNENPAAAAGVVERIFERSNYLTEAKTGTAQPDTSVYYFYTIIAMSCLYGGFHGMKEVSTVQANQSPQGARTSVAPTHKLKQFAVSTLTAMVVQFGVILVFILFLKFALGIDFGDRIWLVILSSALGTYVGVTYGTMISSVVKGHEGYKIGVLISSSMVMTFFAGMMYAGIKNIILKNAPIFAYINPANLISDSFYSLYYYSGYERYILNSVILVLSGILFSAVTYFALRRQRYASI
ncbi:MAG: ABC transporter permease [Eubacteriales bacterium]|nr:ABC transporter permease [Eubacteriales bacterium]MDD4475047.1 ABC transporter permease [Eubacteriales bacterium]